jgi:hypothetical protein
VIIFEVQSYLKVALHIVYFRRRWKPSEGTAATSKRYSYAGGTRVAMREAGTLYWLLTDHLGSTSKAANSDGSLHSEQMYKPFGEKRYPK